MDICTKSKCKQNQPLPIFVAVMPSLHRFLEDYQHSPIFSPKSRFMAPLPLSPYPDLSDFGHWIRHLKTYSAVACHKAENFPSPAIPPDKPIIPKLKPGKPPSNAQCSAIGNQAAGTTASDHHLASAFWSSSSVLTPPFSLPTLLALLCFSSCASLANLTKSHTTPANHARYDQM
jgi:hypothetical protein